MSQHPTRNDLPARSRARIEKLLNERLAEALDLSAAAKQAHWNTKGAHFIALHELFDQVHGNVDEHVDSLAERITALGGQAFGTVQAAVRTSSLKPYPEALSDGWSTWPRSPTGSRLTASWCASRFAKPPSSRMTARPTC
ncbi:MAG: hypothetical protein RL684_414 [Pseudomonadota bacterium]|jgi:starvation-inducible DNA-binding protein